MGTWNDTHCNWCGDTQVVAGQWSHLQDLRAVDVQGTKRKLWQMSRAVEQHRSHLCSSRLSCTPGACWARRRVDVGKQQTFTAHPTQTAPLTFLGVRAATMPAPASEDQHA